MARITPDSSLFDPVDPIQRRAFIPIDTMVEAPRVAVNQQFGNFADALSQFNPVLQTYFSRQQDEARKADADAARAQAVKTGLTYQEAIKRGIINENQSPYFNKAWNEMDGRNTGDTTQASILQTYQTDPISQSGDPKAVASWLQQQISQQAQGITDPNALIGFTTRMQELQPRLLDEFVRQSRDNAVTGMTNTLSTQVGNIIDQYVSNNKGQPIDPDMLAQQVNGAAALPKFAGLDHKTADATVAQTIIEKAKALGNPELLDVLNSDRQDMTKPNSTLPGVGKTAQWSSQIMEAQHAILVQKQQQEDHQYALEQRQRTEAVQSLKGQVFDALLNNQTPDKHMVDQLVKLDGSVAGELQSFQLNNQRLAEGMPMTPTQYATQYNGAINPPDNGLSRVANLTQSVTNGTFHGTTEQLKGLMATAKEFDDAGVEKIKPVADILASFKADPLNQGAPQMFKDPNAVAETSAQFLEGANALIKQNPNAAPESLRQPLMDLRKKVLENYATIHPNAMSMDAAQTDQKPATAPSQEPAKAADEAPKPGPNGGLPGPFAMTPSQRKIVKDNPQSPAALLIRQQHPREYFQIINSQ